MVTYCYSFSLLLKNEFNRRKLKNSKYSLRAFARDLDSSVSSIHDYINENKTPSVSKILSTCKKIGVPESDWVYYTTPISSNNEVDLLFPDLEEIVEDKADLEIQLIKTNLLYQAFFTLSFDSEENFVADRAQSRLGLSDQEANTIVEKLIRAGLLEKDGDRIKHRMGPIVRVKQDEKIQKKIDTTRKSQQSVSYYLEKSLVEENVDISSHSTVVVMSSIKKIDEAKEKIKAFRRELAAFLSHTDEEEELFVLNLNLFPFPENCSSLSRTEK